MGAYIRKPRSRREPKMKRFCLKCDKPFIAEGRFNRLCPKCSKANEDYYERNVVTHPQSI